MSSLARNSRNRKAALPTKADKRRRGSDSSSSLDLSSDGGYSVLDEVSDDDDDDEHDVYAAEEKAIINDVTNPRHTRSSRPTTQQKEHEVAVEDDSDEEENDADDDDDDDDDDSADIPVNYEEDYSSGLDAIVEDSLSWNGILESDINNGSGQSPEKRRVRFTGVSDSDNESESASIASDEFFPNVFVEKQSLDASFRRQIEEESDSSNSATFWDFTAPAHNTIMDSLPASDVANLVASEAAVSTALGRIAAGGGIEVNADSGSGSESSGYLDGYESDGDTTEDDEPQLLPPRRMPAQPVGDVSSDSDSENLVPIRTRRGHPRIGRFALSNKRSKPIAVINPVTKKMVIFTPEAPRETEVLTNPIPLKLQFVPAKGNNLIQSSPVQRQPTSLLFNDTTRAVSNNGIIHSDPVGPSLGLFNEFGIGTSYNDDSDEISAEFGEEPGELSLRIEDFICFDSNSNESEAAQGTAPAETSNAAFDVTGADGADAAFDHLFDTEALDATLAALPAEDVEAAINGLFGDNAVLPDNPFFDTDIGIDIGVDLSSSIMGGNDNNNDIEDGATPAETPKAATPGGGNTTNFSTPVAAVADATLAAANAEPDSPPLHPLMAHFSKNADVGAFRRNQINQQLISSNKATAESLAFSGPLSMGTLRGIKNGSLSAVSAPLTPPRRPKRKAHETTLDGSTAHKRYRSISEVKDLTL